MQILRNFDFIEKIGKRSSTNIRSVSPLTKNGKKKEM